MNFNVNFDISFWHDRKKSNLISDRSQIPWIIWEISAFWLHICHWCKLSSTEHKFLIFFVILKIFNVIWWPALLSIVPNCNFRFICLMNINIWWKDVNDLNWLNLSSRIWIWVWHFFQSIIHWFDGSHLPFYHSSWKFRWLVESIVYHTSHTDIVKLFRVFSARYVIKTGPVISHYQADRLLLMGQVALIVPKTNFLDLLFSNDVSPHTKW